MKEQSAGNETMTLQETRRTPEPHLEKILVQGEEFYCIRHYDEMRPFFMNLVSDNNLWMFLSSNGGITAGRINSQQAIFPYYTDDKITDLAPVTGSVTHIRYTDSSFNTHVWSPFAGYILPGYNSERSISKSVLGNRILFEETNHDIQLSFQYGWSFSNRFGIVRTATLVNRGDQEISLDLLDGVQNILPANVGERLQTWRSNLVDAYRKNELLSDPEMAVFSLSAQIVDKPEPSESLRATVAWSLGLENATTLLCGRQIRSFLTGGRVHAEQDIRAERGAFIKQTRVTLQPGETKEWLILLDIGLGAGEVINLQQLIRNDQNIWQTVLNDTANGQEQLRTLLQAADGIQYSADHLSTARHQSNVLFNILRGGVFTEQYEVRSADFLQYLEQHNKEAAHVYRTRLHNGKRTIPRRYLLDACRIHPSLYRLAMEYLPLYFSRRHGDPSRPWNEFNIHTQTETGEQLFDYEGNWRDIFQNWEALARSFPEYTSAMIARFLNATTADGYNPYRINRDGMDWEIADPNDPWSHIGYWSDHQIIYLLKLLETSEQFYPGKLQLGLDDRIYAFANVPYRILPFDNMLQDPHDTIHYDQQEADRIDNRFELIGSDGKLLWDSDGRIIHTTLAEKLLLPLLAKLSNYVHEGGIWLNTQRPEWNDANNALVGNGLSVVTLQYMRRYVQFLLGIYPATGTLTVGAEMKGWLEELHAIFQQHETDLKKPFTDAKRMQMMSRLGHAAQHYNRQVYNGLSGYTANLHNKKLNEFLQLVLSYIDVTLHANKRSDHLYHAYNLMKVDTNAGTVTIEHMYLMLEGQVAALSSGRLLPEEAHLLLDALKDSPLYREDQYSYLLYPDRQLPTFIHKNTFSGQGHETLLHQLDALPGQPIVSKDAAGNWHFHKDIANADHLEQKLEDCLKISGWQPDEAQRSDLLNLYESVFQHHRFTGRSGTFYGYEGLNCIYWHMVSKLLLAVQENILKAYDIAADAVTTGKLIEHYYEIRAGIGLNKTPAVYGAFPTDPYSHTPGNKGAQQPGMTGQVKEDIICRFGELGLVVQDGCIRFHPGLLRKNEFIATADDATLLFTFCGTRICYHLTEQTPRIMITDVHQHIHEITGSTLDQEWSLEIFGRSGKISCIDVFIAPAIA